MKELWRPQIANDNEFYTFIDTIAQRLRSSGFVKDADSLNSLLHQTGWFTSKLRGEFGGLANSDTAKEQNMAATITSPKLVRRVPGQRGIRPNEKEISHGRVSWQTR